MYICTNCNKEMRCSHTGTRVRYGSDGSHVYAGDSFECPNCGNKIVACPSPAYFDKNPHINQTDICMDEITVKTPPKINLRRTTEEYNERIEPKSGHGDYRSGNSESKDEPRIRDAAYGDTYSNVPAIQELIGLWINTLDPTTRPRRPPPPPPPPPPKR